MDDTYIQQWTRDAVSGDTVSFGKLYDCYIQELYRFVYYKTHHTQTAEDITADVFIKALDNIASYDETKASFRTWLYTISRRTVIDHYRTDKFALSIDADDAWDIPSEDNTREQVHAKVDVAVLQPYLNQLSSEQRDVIMLRLWEQLSYKEIAEILGKSEASCKMAFSRSMKTLKDAMPISLYLLFAITSIL